MRRIRFGLLTRVLAGVAVTCALCACAHRAGVDGKAAPNATLDPRLRAKQVELVEYDRAAEERLRAEVARIAGGSARDVTRADSLVERFVLTVTNRGVRPIRRVDDGVIVYDAKTLHRLGLSTFSAATDIVPCATVTVPVAIPMAAFAEGAGPLARSAGQAKKIQLTLTGFGLAGGSEAGEHD
jgi:hypothetical protein